MTVDAQLASTHVPVLYLVEMGFVSGTLRVTSWNHPITWMGYEWAALGTLSSVSAIKLADRAEYPAMDLALSVANDAILATALGSPADYRHRPVTIYQAFLDDELRPLGDPELAWAGEMSQVRVNTGAGEGDMGSVVMRCEPQGKDKRGASSLRLNNAQHQRRWPGDTFLTRIEGLSGKPVPWLSVRFQRV